jgi:hypothetical protein
VSREGFINYHFLIDKTAAPVTITDSRTASKSPAPARAKSSKPPAMILVRQVRTKNVKKEITNFWTDPSASSP